ncbi:hypothetical protein J3R83DRAFT_11549 [Lanmaoa asiatica]|nr:hypothetical protein J3R83DRAFT_11549 [Lanmaoa asiatica]
MTTGATFFAHSSETKLRQLDIRDEDDELIPPERWYSELRQATLVTARVRATLHALNFESRRVYRSTAHAINVLDESALPVEERTRTILPASAGSANTLRAALLMSSVQLGKRARQT